MPSADCSAVRRRALVRPFLHGFDELFAGSGGPGGRCARVHRGRRAAPQLGLALLGRPLLLLTGALLDRQDDFGPRASEPLPVQVFDEERERELPALLAVVVESAELLRVHAKLTRHLHVSVGKVMPLSGIDPGAQAVRYPPLLHFRPPRLRPPDPDGRCKSSCKSRSRASNHGSATRRMRRM